MDGQGTILTSETTNRNRNRNPGLSKSQAERILCDALGGTGGHIDAIGAGRGRY